jgi:hypothetical protein
MQISIFKLMLAVPLVLISSFLPCSADWQAAPAPSVSTQAIGRYEQMIQGMSPGTLNLLAARASGLLHANGGAAPNSSERQELRQELKQYLPELQELKQNKAELLEMKARLCSLISC